MRKRGKTLSKNHYHYLFLKGWKWWDKSGTVTKKNAGKWVQQSNTRTSDNREQFRPVRHSISGARGKCYGKGPECFTVCYQNCDWIFRVLIWQMKYEKKLLYLKVSTEYKKSFAFAETYCTALSSHLVDHPFCRGPMNKCFGGDLRAGVTGHLCCGKAKLQGTVQMWA